MRIALRVCLFLFDLRRVLSVVSEANDGHVVVVQRVADDIWRKNELSLFFRTSIRYGYPPSNTWILGQAPDRIFDAPAFGSRFFWTVSFRPGTKASLVESCRFRPTNTARQDPH